MRSCNPKSFAASDKDSVAIVHPDQVSAGFLGESNRVLVTRVERDRRKDHLLKGRWKNLFVSDRYEMVDRARRR
jgi:hypothetical protein